MKRLLDVMLSLLLLVLLLPLLAGIAILVRLSSPGPVLFRQNRVGLAGKDFFMLKFRTMTERPDSAGNMAQLKMRPRASRERDLPHRRRMDCQTRPIGRKTRPDRAIDSSVRAFLASGDFANPLWANAVEFGPVLFVGHSSCRRRRGLQLDRAAIRDGDSIQLLDKRPLPLLIWMPAPEERR